MALKLGASIAHDLGGYGPVIARAHEAGWHPGFAQQLGRDPAATIAAGIAAMKICFQLEEPMTKTRPRPAPEKGQRKPRSRAKKPTEPAAGIDPAPELEAAPGAAKPAPLEMSRQELEHGGTRIAVGVWEKSKNGARIVVTLDRKAGTWACEIERNGIHVRRQGRGYLSVCRATISDLNAKEQSQ